MFSGIANVIHKPSLKPALLCDIDHGEWQVDLSKQVDNSRAAVLASASYILLTFGSYYYRIIVPFVSIFGVFI